jgi:hypothetical protein
MMLDQMGALGEKLTLMLAAHDTLAKEIIADTVRVTFGRKALKLSGLAKLARNAVVIVAGMLMGAAANVELGRHGMQFHPDVRQHKLKIRA